MDKPYGIIAPEPHAARFKPPAIGSPGFGMVVSGIAVVVAVAGILTGRIAATKPPVASAALAPAQADGGTPYVPVDDNGAPNAFGARYSYRGRWEHVQSQYDGRSLGTSSRSFTPGASATLRYTGENVNLYGVTGPNGGTATIRIDGSPHGTIQFYSPKKAANALVFSSGGSRKVHTSSRSSSKVRSGSTRRFVNLDGAIYAAHPASP